MFEVKSWVVISKRQQLVRAWVPKHPWHPSLIGSYTCPDSSFALYGYIWVLGLKHNLITLMC